VFADRFVELLRAIALAVRIRICCPVRAIR
jgi:hypothetical protein